MKTILFFAALFCVYKLITKLSAESKERQHEAERQRIRDEQASIRAEQERQKAQIRAEIERAKLETHERIEAEKRRIEWQKRQDAINARLEKEQERQAAQLERHERRFAELEFRVTEAEAAILDEQKNLDHYTAKLSACDDRIAELDREIEHQAACRNGALEAKARAEREKVSDKIFSLEKSVRACEKRMAKAQHIKDMAKREMSA